MYWVFAKNFVRCNNLEAEISQYVTVWWGHWQGRSNILDNINDTKECSHRKKSLSHISKVNVFGLLKLISTPSICWSVPGECLIAYVLSIFLSLHITIHETLLILIRRSRSLIRKWSTIVSINNIEHSKFTQPKLKGLLNTCISTIDSFIRFEASEAAYTYIWIMHLETELSRFLRSF